jgi:hypothetical protein
MKKLALISTVVLYLGLALKGQPAVYTHPDKLPSEYRFDGHREYQKLMAQRMPAGVKPQDYSRYAEFVSFRKQDWFTNGDTYLAWEPVESYLNSVVQKLAEESRDGRALRIYVLRQSNSNAYALHDGTLFITLGMLAEVYNEAALAAILGHEIAHYKHQDVRASFIKRLKLFHPKTKNNEEHALTLEMAHEDREQELVADSVGYLLAHKAGYDIGQALRNFYLWIGKEEALWLGWRHKDGSQKKPGKLKQRTDEDKEDKDLLASHPEFSVRMDQLERMQKSKGVGQSWVVSDSLFQVMQDLARIELLQVLLEESNLKTCASKAFTYYLEDPADQVPVYYLLESVRRLLYLKPELENKGFLTETDTRVPDTLGVLSVIHWLEVDPEKRERFNMALVMQDSVPVFTNYTEAFAHFSSVASTNDWQLCYFPMALKALAAGDTTGFQLLRQSRDAFPDYMGFIDKVSSLEGKKNPDKLLSDISTSGRQDLVMVNSFRLIENKYYGIHEKSLLAAEKRSNYLAGLQQMTSKQYPTYELIDYQTMAPDNLHYARELRRAFSSTLLMFILDQEDEYEDRGTTIYFSEDDKRGKDKKDSKTQTKNLFVFDPALFATFNNNNLNSIAFLSIWGVDDKTQWIKALNIINPLYYYFFFSNMASAATSGSDRYGYGVDMVQVRPGSKKRVGVYSEIIPYKLNQGHLQNTVYYAIEICK